MKISFVIPCMNAGAIIKNSVKKLNKELNKIKKLNYELIIIDDGSTDKTNKIIKSLKKKNIKIVTNLINLGKSSSLIKGIKLAKYKKIIIWDCDLPYFQYMRKIIKLLDNKDLIYINRKSNESKLASKNLNFYQFSRFLISNIVCITINLLLMKKNMGDTQAGLKAFNKPKNFNKIKFLSKKFFFDAELMILFNRAGAKMTSVPLKYRIYKKSTIKIFKLENFLYLFELIKVILFYRIRKTKKIIF